MNFDEKTVLMAEMEETDGYTSKMKIDSTLEESIESVILSIDR